MATEPARLIRARAAFRCTFSSHTSDLARGYVG